MDKVSEVLDGCGRERQDECTNVVDGWRIYERLVICFRPLFLLQIIVSGHSLIAQPCCGTAFPAPPSVRHGSRLVGQPTCHHQRKSLLDASGQKKSGVEMDACRCRTRLSLRWWQVEGHNGLKWVTTVSIRSKVRCPELEAWTVF